MKTTRSYAYWLAVAGASLILGQLPAPAETLPFTWGRSGRPAPEAAVESVHDVLLEVAEDYTRAEGVVATANSEQKDHPASLAIDTSLATSWVATTSPSTLAVDLGETRRINAVAWVQAAAGSNASRAPLDYRIEATVDGETWTTVVEVSDHQGPDRVDYFPEVQARYVRLITNKVQPGGPSTVCIAEFRVLHAPEALPAGWLRPDCTYRQRLAVGRSVAEKTFPGLLSLRLDPGQILAEPQWLDPSSFAVIDLQAAPGQGEIPSTWTYDDRYDGSTYTQGRIAMFLAERPPTEATFDLYFNAPEGEPESAAAPPPDTIVLRQQPGQRQLTFAIDDPAGVDEVLVFDDAGLRLPFTVTNHMQGLVDPISLHHRYCVAYRNGQNRWRSTWLKPVPLQEGRVGFDIPRTTYIYGQPLETTLTPNPPLAEGTPTTRLHTWLEDAQAGQRYYQQSNLASPGQPLSLSLAPLWLKPGAYLLCAQLESEGQVLRAGPAEIVVVPAPPTEAFYQLWAIPNHSRAEIDLWLPRLQAMGFNNVSNKTWRPLDYLLDQAPRYGVTVMPSSVVSAYLPRDGERHSIASSGDPVEHVMGRESLIHPEVRAAGQKRLTDELQAVLAYPGFSGYMEYFDDRLLGRGEQVEGSDRYNLADYSEYTLKVFKEKYGYLPPRVQELEIPPPGTIISDDDPWLNWTIFRADDYYAGFAAALREAKDEIAPQVKISPVHGIGDCYYRPAFGVSVPYDMRAVDYLRSYHYTSGWPRWRHPNLDFLFQTEMGRIGNREKECFLLGGSIGGEEVAPAWLLTNKIACLLAAGQNHVALATYAPWSNRSVTVWDVPEARQALTEGGRKIAQLSPLLTRREFAPKEVALLVSLSTSAYTDALNEHPDSSKHRPGVRNTYHALLLAGVPAELVDETELLAGRADQYKALVLAEVDYLRQSVYEALAGFAEQGGLLLADENTDVEVPGMQRFGNFAELTEELRARVETHYQFSTPGLVVRRFLVGDTEYLFVINAVTDLVYFTYDYSELWELDFPELGIALTKGPAEPREVQTTLTLHRPEPIGAAYDLETGRRLLVRPTEGGCKIPVKVAPGDLTIIAIQPAPVGKVELQAPERVRRGRELLLTVRVFDRQGQPAQGSELIELKVMDPTGQVDRRFSRSALVTEGQATWILRLADNELTGDWQVRVQSLSTGKTLETTITVGK